MPCLAAGAGLRSMWGNAPMNQTPILHVEGINKRFGAVQALKDVDLSLQSSEIHGLLGGNGAGKTTLMNVVYGLYKPDSGQIFLRGRPVTINSPRDAIAHGIGMVHQHFLQINTYTVTENIVLGTPIPHRPTMDLTQARDKIRALSDRFGLEIDPEAHIEDLPMGARQRVEILKALYRGVDILILDEPTTNLTPQEVDSLFESLKLMVAEGMSVVFITHKLREVMSVCDTISVLREGRRLLTAPRSELSEEEIVRTMVGSEEALEDSMLFSEQRRDEEAGIVREEIVLDVSDMRIADENGVLVDDLSLSVRAGEILGIAGVAGNGQQELAEGILGIRPLSRGRVRIGDRDVTGLGTRQILHLGVAYVPEDRLQDGFLPTASVAQNLILGAQRRTPYSSARGVLNRRAITETAVALIQRFHIRTQGPEDMAATLSGGNIQRMMLARAFAHPVRLLILHNPTSGLDIPSVEFVYDLLLSHKREGTATLLISDDLDELMLLSDRIATLYRGRIVGVLERSAFDKYTIGRMMSGVEAHD
ncbi:MAG: ABC transporter ATP-binding protein [Caldilineae bacterium]|nr:MAG: ABC transporter ATP-binding protein [Caldilineae bacterium]